MDLEGSLQTSKEVARAIPHRFPLTVYVNLSARQFRLPNLDKEIAQILRETGLDAECLNLEITESVVMLRRLKELGVKLAIDDFGTGYSSLSYLDRFPVDTLKIDKSFVAQLRGGEYLQDVPLVSG